MLLFRLPADGSAAFPEPYEGSAFARATRNFIWIYVLLWAVQGVAAAARCSGRGRGGDARRSAGGRAPHRSRRT
jgi:hypothetical protein